MKPATQVLIERYQKHLYAIAFNICRNQQDAEDVVQDTFIQYHTYKKEFDTEEHIRAWLIRVAINKAKNITRSFWHRNKCNLEEYMETPESHAIYKYCVEVMEHEPGLGSRPNNDLWFETEQQAQDFMKRKESCTSSYVSYKYVGLKLYKGK